jgi:Uma2 family endonuclease
VSCVVPEVYRVGFADWLNSPDDGLRREIIDGEMVVTPPPNISHQRASREIEFRLLVFLRDRGLGEVFNAPVGVKLSETNVFEPDLVVVLHGGRATIDERAIIGPPDLLAEILSAGTARRDLSVKRSAYEAAGVREYWVVDPVAMTIEVLALVGDVYQRHGLFDLDKPLTSPVLPGFELRLRDVFALR